MKTPDLERIKRSNATSDYFREQRRGREEYEAKQLVADAEETRRLGRVRAERESGISYDWAAWDLYQANRAPANPLTKLAPTVQTTSCRSGDRRAGP